MGSSVNKVFLLGYLGKDPEIRYTRDDKAVASFSMATSEQWKDARGERQERTEWHNCVVFGKLAEIVEDYLKKGSRVYIEGKLTTEKWEDKNGETRYTTKINVAELSMLGESGGRGERDDDRSRDRDARGGGRGERGGGRGADRGARRDRDGDRDADRDRGRDRGGRESSDRGDGNGRKPASSDDDDHPAPRKPERKYQDKRQFDDVDDDIPF